jgi:plasmid stabilization system protein ParE
MAKPVVLTAIAEIDLEQITTYLFDHWGVSVSNNFLDRFEEICSLISSSPAIFPLIHKSRRSENAR